MALLRSFSGQDGQSSDNPALRTAVLAEMEQAAPILNLAEFYAMTGNADTLLGAAEMTGAGEQRAPGSDFATAASSNPSETSVSLKISGDVIKTDLAYVRRGYTPEGLRLRDTRSYARSLGRYIQDQFINGTGIGQNVSGIATQVTAGQTITFSSVDGGLIELGNSDAKKAIQQEFLEAIDLLIESVKDGAQALLMDAKLVAMLKAIGREYVTTSRVVDIYGREQDVTSYGNVPIIRAGFKSNGTDKVLPFTEQVGASTDCGSIYAVRFGEREMCSLPTNIGLVVKDEGLSDNNYKTRIELDWNVLIENAKSIAKLEGVRV